jgi:hypothetical protein
VTRKIENPYWSNKDTKHVIAEFVYEDGKRQLASIMGDENNPDFKEIMELFTEEEIDANTKVRLDKRDEQVRRNRERQEVDRSRMQQETLFAAKLDAFEIPIIKTSTNRAAKAKIRKAKTLMEVTAYAIMLMMQEEANTAIVTEAQDAE